MSAKKHGLGRGFKSLIPDDFDLIDDSFDPTASEDEKVSDLRKIFISDTQPDKDQPRKDFDQEALEELSMSIKEHGVLQPIVVYPKAGKFIIVAGERRYRAAKMAGLDKIPAIVRTMSSQHILEVSLIENLQRKDLNPLETATAFMKLKNQFNLSMDDIAKRMGAKSISAISNKMRLLKLPKDVQVMVAEKKLKEGQVRPLIGLEPELAIDIAKKIVKEGWSARKVEQFIVQLKEQGSSSEKRTNNLSKVEDYYKKDLEKISKSLDTKVKIRSNSKGSGTITLAFKNKDDFDRIEKLLLK